MSEVYYPFNTLEEKQAILDRNTGLTFQRTATSQDKRFLVFEDGLEPPFEFPSEVQKAFALVVLDEINSLRNELNGLLDPSSQLSIRTIAELKAAVQRKMGGL